MRAWVNLGPRYLPFADAATPDLPLSRLLRLSLFQVSVGMALVLLIGTLNRVMIVELEVPASLVAVMISLPLIFAPFRALIGFRSDTHRSVLGWKRVPYIWQGTLVQWGGLAIMPFALLVLTGQGESSHAPVWLGHLGAGFAFLLVGAGIHTTQTVGLALATDLAPVESQPNIDNGNDAASNINNPFCIRREVGNRSNFLNTNNLYHIRNWNAEKLVISPKGKIFSIHFGDAAFGILTIYALLNRIINVTLFYLFHFNPLILLIVRKKIY